MKRGIYIIIAFLLFSCNIKNVQQELNNVRNDFEKVSQELENCKQVKLDNYLIHQVYFKLKDNISNEDKILFIKGLEKLNSIEVVENIIVEEREDVGDESRALTQFDVLMQLTFENKAALDIYSNHTYHQEIKKEIGGFLAAPPMTFDFVDGE